MHRITIDQWVFDSEEEFSSDCPAASAIFERADAEAKADAVPWFFESGYANFKAGTAHAAFTSYRTPEYAGFALDISASKAPDGSWTCAATKNIPPHADRDAKNQ